MYPQMLDLHEDFIKTSLYGFTRRRGKILVVTNHLLTLDSMKHLLEDHLYFVQAARSSKRALQAARKFLPDLIIIDTMFPYTLGIELCQHFKEEESTKQIPVFFVVTSGQPKDKEEIFIAGGVDYTTRPFCNEELLARLEVHLTIQSLKAELEIECREKMRLSQELKLSERRAHDLEEDLYTERITHERRVVAIRLALVSRIVTVIAQELRSRLDTIYKNLIHAKELVQENPGASDLLECSLVKVERLLKTLTNLNRICKL
jgi:DNA-binding response OmpR family regulator